MNSSEAERRRANDFFQWPSQSELKMIEFILASTDPIGISERPNNIVSKALSASQQVILWSAFLALEPRKAGRKEGRPPPSIGCVISANPSAIGLCTRANGSLLACEHKQGSRISGAHGHIEIEPFPFPRGFGYPIPQRASSVDRTDIC